MTSHVCVLHEFFSLQLFTCFSLYPTDVRPHISNIRKFISSGFAVVVVVVESKSIYASPFKIVHCRPILFHCPGFSVIWKQVRLRMLFNASLTKFELHAFGSCF